ncbi:MAG: argininosuccinate lyase [Candidatus Marinimicrobia bacterium]|nr:argininosuccinate lyase [Candidatus Neomarinimicrobiota bacterium]|tara:strand:+ start:6716 stop:7891 length:1176 start_codon:yes stop_codon:yes gene_type:complete
MGKIWDKGFEVDKRVEEFTVGNDFLIDMKLINYDCKASIIHAKMLRKIGVLSKTELKKIINALNEIINSNDLTIKINDEDCHTAIENYLIKKIGDAGKKIHTARSRNDQVLTALRLYYLDNIKNCDLLQKEWIKSLKNFKNKFGTINFPGYTHFRKAMPSSINMWSEAFIESSIDNTKLLKVSKNIINKSPLGTAAGYGVPMNIDREFTAKEMGFDSNQNPIYAQISRGKFEKLLIHSLVQIMYDINKISSDLILFSMDELGYFEIPEKFCTGSSIMPQKNNPDVLELLRAKYNNVRSYESEVLNITSNLPSGFHRDFQLTKEPTMKAIETTLDCIKMITMLINELVVNEKRCDEALSEEIYATEKAYKLVEKGVPFRSAYKIIAKELSKK